MFEAIPVTGGGEGESERELARESETTVAFGSVVFLSSFSLEYGDSGTASWS